MQRLAESTMALYAELLEQSLAFERLAGVDVTPPGSLVSKMIKGEPYLYWQISKGEHKWQRYLGPDSPDLRASIEQARERRHELAPERESIDRLGAMLLEGGVLAEPSPVLSVLGLLADVGVFRRGGVLVGTQAFRLYGNLLGFSLAGTALRTQDIDIADRLDVALASEAEASAGVENGLSALGFVPVPRLDLRQPSTSFKVRGRELRVDFLVPSRATDSKEPVEVPGLDLCAQPLPGLGYLIEDPTPALALGRRPVLVRIPRPGRFALHKLWTASQRPAAEQAKARKDRIQAAVLLEILEEERPQDFVEARGALPRAMKRLVESELRSLPRGPRKLP